MPEPDEGDRLRDLEARLTKARDRGRKPAKATTGGHAQAELGWRMVIELVSGLLVGFAIGYGLDSLFGTAPVLMVIFTLLGFAAGVRIMLRSANEYQARAARAADGTDATKDEE